MRFVAREANSKLLLPWACCHGKGVQISYNPLPWASGKIQLLSLSFATTSYCILPAPSEVCYNYYMSSVSCKTKDTFASFSQQSTPAWFFSLCISSLLKGAARSKSITSAQLAHSEEHQQHVEEVLTYLLTDLLLKREGGLGRVSVPLKLDWSVPASKSSQSVSRTVRCLVLWSWWNFVQPVASAFFELLLSFSFT